jgi:hypothetical protein
MPITDLSMLSALDIKQRNLRFFNDRSHEYQLVNGNYDLTRRRIMNVRIHDLRRIMREFPTDLPLVNQGGAWMRALVGKHFFPDANHRTAMMTFRYLMGENGHSPPPLDIESIERITRDSKKVRRDIVDVRFDTLWEKDELYAVWCAFFRESL